MSRAPEQRMHPVWRRIVGAGFAFLLLLTITGPAGADTKSKLQAARRRLTQIEAQIQDQSARLAELRADVSEAGRRVEEAHDAVRATQIELAETHERLAAADRRYRALRDLLEARARDAYITGPGSSLAFLLGSQTIAELSERVELVEAVAQNDADLAARVEVLRTALEAERVRLEQVRERQVALQEALEAEKAQLEANFDEQVAIVADLADARAELASIVDQLEDRLRAEELARIRAAREAAERAANADPVGDSGGGGGGGGGDGPLFICPVDQPRAYSDTFGDPRSGGRTHQGADIFAPMGTPIRAPFPGSASDATNWPLGGYSVKVYGSQGYVYNAHLSRIGQLGSVQTGDVVGYVGNTGNASGASPHDHFEWHPGGGAAVNPTSYLDEVC
jgi:peptidoglycan hydrolase CwlO-like protein